MLTIHEKIGKKIQRLRKDKGWTQEELAERSGYHSTYIGGIERGERNATLEAFGRIADAFNISLENLFRLEPHALENLFNAPADDIMEAILSGFRAQVDVKGKLAELYLSRYLDDLKQTHKIDTFIWNDKDNLPDFLISYKGKEYILECKNLRSGKGGIYVKKPSYKVEVQKTRNSKDGSNTRSYPVNYFHILAVCMFNQKRRWDFIFIANKYLKKAKDESFLAIFQAVPLKPLSPWEKDIIVVLEDISKELN
jgi:transcriptional regulator with XRE-family HTH domain